MRRACCRTQCRGGARGVRIVRRDVRDARDARSRFSVARRSTTPGRRRWRRIRLPALNRCRRASARWPTRWMPRTYEAKARERYVAPRGCTEKDPPARRGSSAMRSARRRHRRWREPARAINSTGRGGCGSARGGGTVKKYLEAEEGARAVFAAAKITRRDAETAAPGATKAERASRFESERRSEGRSRTSSRRTRSGGVRGVGKTDTAAWGMESEEGEGEESEEEGERTEAENGTRRENGRRARRTDGGGERRRRVGADDPTAPAPREPSRGEEAEEAEEVEEVENTTEFAEEASRGAPSEKHHPDSARLEARADPQRENPENPDDPEDLDDPDEVERPRSRTTPKRRGRRRTTRRSTRTTTRTRDHGRLALRRAATTQGRAFEAAEDDDGADARPDVDALAVARTADAPSSRTADTSFMSRRVTLRTSTTAPRGTRRDAFTSGDHFV